MVTTQALGRMVPPWAASSVGERLPHTQEVVGSTPTPPTSQRHVAPSSSGLGRSPLKAETAGSNPAGATPIHITRAEGVYNVPHEADPNPHR